MIKKIFIVLVALLVVAAGASYLLPGSYEVVRSTSIAAAPDAIYPSVADLKTWPEWTAWSHEADRECEWTYPTATTGAGSKTSWDGPTLGQGELELTKADPARGVHYNISFDGGKYRGNGNLRFDPDGTNTKVTWTARGALGRNPVNRYFGLLMDNMLGSDLQKSLDGLKARVESGASTETPTPNPEAGEEPTENG